MTAGHEQDLFATLARQLAAEEDVSAVWQRVVDASVAEIAGAQHAGIMLVSRRSVQTPVASDDLVVTIDKHQYETREGPCLSAAIEHAPVVRVNDLRTETRWPQFAARAAEAGVLSILSFQLYTEQDTLGALNIYAGTADAFTDDSVHTGTLLAAHAAVAAAATLKTTNLLIALTSRDVIGQAKGILMERYRITPEQAFDLLITASQRTHRKLHEIARDLTETGELRTQ
ncbi:MAG: GAF and ANTAR domain-containing protein [Gordonia polyisoprenivorans]|nr:GAF and ANTAR domain-containing protein [Gordonia polyisoprenivorans]